MGTRNLGEVGGWFEPDPGLDIDDRQAGAVLAALPPDELDRVRFQTGGGLTLEETGAAVERSAPAGLRGYCEAFCRIRIQLEQPCLTKIQ
jgi:hypothetical protein